MVQSPELGVDAVFVDMTGSAGKSLRSLHHWTVDRFGLAGGEAVRIARRPVTSVGKVVCFSIFLNLEILFFQIYHCKELSFLFSKLERMITKHDDAKCVNKAVAVMSVKLLCCMQSGFEVK